MIIPLSTCTLRNFRFGDENSLQQNADNIAVWQNLRDSFPHPFSLNDAINWISMNNAFQKPLNLAITVDDRVVGGIGILQQTDIYRLNGEIGYWLGEPFWNKGIMSEAVPAMINYTFANFEIIRVYASVFEHNLASMRVLEKAGFHQEAIHQKAIFKNGVLLDEYLFTIIKPGA